MTRLRAGVRFLVVARDNTVLHSIHTGAVCCAVTVRNVSWMLLQEGRSSNLRLRRVLGQAAHAVIPTSSVLEFIVYEQ